MSRAKYDWIWEGMFNDTVEDALIEPEWFDACIDAAEKLGVPIHGARVSALDPADTGTDENAYASRRGIHFDTVMEIDKPNGNLACDAACELAKSQNTDLFVWDGDGMGALLRKQIAQTGGPEPSTWRVPLFERQRLVATWTNAADAQPVTSLRPAS